MTELISIELNGLRKPAMTKRPRRLHYVPSGNNLKVAIARGTGAAVPSGWSSTTCSAARTRCRSSRINPNAKLPAIVDHAPADGGEPLAVFESGAILLYLAEKAGRLMPTEWRRRHVAQQWLVWQVAGLGPMLGQANHFVRYAPEGQDYAVERYLREAQRLLTVLDRRRGSANTSPMNTAWPTSRAFRGPQRPVPWHRHRRLPGIGAMDRAHRAAAAVAAARAAIMQDDDRAKYMQAGQTDAMRVVHLVRGPIAGGGARAGDFRRSARQWFRASRSPPTLHPRSPEIGATQAVW
jgi:glutathione S-transferase